MTPDPVAIDVNRDVARPCDPHRKKVRCSDTMARAQHVRCSWVNADDSLMRDYHDHEWGVPTHDDRRHFEFLVLEAAQAGLSWSIVLKKREGYRRAFSQFDPETVARYSPARIEKLTADPGIVRNRLKIAAAVKNARGFVARAERIRQLRRLLLAIRRWPPTAEPLDLAASDSGNDGSVGCLQPRSQAPRVHVRRIDSAIPVWRGVGGGPAGCCTNTASTSTEMGSAGSNVERRRAITHARAIARLGLRWSTRRHQHDDGEERLPENRRHESLSSYRA